MIFLTWKWRAKSGYRSIFRATHVNILAKMIERHYHKPHEVVCITDDPAGIDKKIRTIPLWQDYANVPSPHGVLNPSCYRRLKMFSAEAKEIIGERFLSMDLDCVITGDLEPLIDRPEDFVAWGDTHKTTYYNGGLILLRAGTRRQVWETFDPIESPKRSRELGQWGSDQGWIGACLGPNEPKWTTEDGVYSWRNHLAKERGRLPMNARIVLFHGQIDPWSPIAQQNQWVREHYNIASSR